MEQNHTTEDISGLESLGNSQVITNIGQFLSLEELGLPKASTENNDIPLDDVNDVGEPATPTKPVTTGIPGLDLLPNEETGNNAEPAANPTVKVTETELDNLEGLNDGIDLEEEEIPVIGATDYKSMLTDLIEQGIIPGIEAFETEEGEVPFDDMVIDKDTFLSIIKNNQDELKESIKATSIDVDGISEFTKKLISIEKHGGNVQQALETYQQVKHPIETIDLTDVRGQKAMCYLRLQAQGIDDKMAKDLILSFEAQGTLEERAYESKEQLDTAFAESIAKQEELAIEEEKNFKAALKTYRTTLDSVFKEQQISDAHRKKLLDVATKQNDRGEFELDTLIENFRKNPVDAADLILFITNKEDYIKSKSEALLKQERINTLKKVNVIPKGRTNTLTVPEGTSPNKDPYLLDLSKL